MLLFHVCVQMYVRSRFRLSLHSIWNISFNFKDKYHYHMFIDHRKKYSPVKYWSNAKSAITSIERDYKPRGQKAAKGDCRQTSWTNKLWWGVPSRMHAASPEVTFLYEDTKCMLLPAACAGFTRNCFSEGPSQRNGTLSTRWINGLLFTHILTYWGMFKVSWFYFKCNGAVPVTSAFTWLNFLSTFAFHRSFTD